MATASTTIVKKVSATALRSHLKATLKAVKGDKVVLVENRRQDAKYLVDKNWLDNLVRERESILATLEVLADRNLTGRLMKLAKTIDQDVDAGRLYTMDDVFGES